MNLRPKTCWRDRGEQVSSCSGLGIVAEAAEVSDDGRSAKGRALSTWQPDHVSLCAA